MSQQKVQSKPKLMYFDARGGAELSRLCFAAAGVDYEDYRFKDGTWKDSEDKKRMPLKALPVLELDGKRYCQSNAIARYICREYSKEKLYGTTPLDGLKIDEIHEAVVEVLIKAYEGVFGGDEAQKAAKQKTFREETLPKFVEFFEKKILADDGRKFLVGDNLTLADLALFNFLDNVEKLSGGKLESVKLKNFKDYVEKQERIAAWIAKRPNTNF